MQIYPKIFSKSWGDVCLDFHDDWQPLVTEPTLGSESSVKILSYKATSVWKCRNFLLGIVSDVGPISDIRAASDSTQRHNSIAEMHLSLCRSNVWAVSLAIMSGLVPGLATGMRLSANSLVPKTIQLVLSQFINGQFISSKVIHIYSQSSECFPC